MNNRAKIRLKHKALLVLASAIVFCAIEVGLALYFKADLIDDFDTLQRLYRKENAINLNFVIADFAAYNSEKNQFSTDDHSELVTEWKKHIELLLGAEEFSVGSGAVPLLPSGVPLADLRKNKDDLSNQLIRVRSKYKEMTRAYHEKSNYFALIVLVMGLFGFLLATFVATVFFSRLVAALQQLRGQAYKIMASDYGQPLKTSRRDEIGDLFDAVNEMSDSLERHEIQAATFQNRLAQQEKVFALGTFAAELAHEVGNPIQAIVALTEKMHGDLLELNNSEFMADTIERIEIIQQEAMRLSSTVREFRDFSSPAESQFEPVDVNEVIKKTLSLLRFDPRFKDIQLKTEFSHDPLQVWGVADELAQVWLNLFINAADAMGHKAGQIVVRSHSEDASAIVEISDNGDGMATDVLDRAMEPFFSTKPKGKGTGLGLAVCKTIVEKHLGQMKFESAPGEGTTVRIRIPMQTGGANHAGANS